MNNPVLWALAAAAALLFWKRRGADGIKGDFVEATPFLENGAAAHGDPTYIPQATPRTELHQPVPYLDGVPDGWSLFQLGEGGARTYTRGTDGLYYLAGAFDPGAAVFLRVASTAHQAGGADGPVDPATNGDNNTDEPWLYNPDRESWD